MNSGGAHEREFIAFGVLWPREYAAPPTQCWDERGGKPHVRQIMVAATAV